MASSDIPQLLEREDKEEGVELAHNGNMYDHKLMHYYEQKNRSTGERTMSE